MVARISFIHALLYYYSLQAWLQENSRDVRFVVEKFIHGSSPPSFDPLAEPPERVSQNSGKMPWYIGFLHVMHHLLNNVVMIIPVKVTYTGLDCFGYKVNKCMLSCDLSADHVCFYAFKDRRN